MQTADFDDPAFLARLRAGDGGAYRQLIRRFHASLVSVANSIIGSRAQAEEVVQDAWLAVFNSIDRFEGRSSLATWLFSIVLNRARTRAGREARLFALPGVLDGAQGNERAVDVTEFQPDGHWIDAPRLWDELSPERVVAGRQLWAHVQEAIERLPAGQRAVIILRDMEGRDAEEACTLLGISAENQRVLLHRARGRIRKTIDALVAGPTPAAAIAATGARPSPRPPRRGPSVALEWLITWAPAWMVPRPASYAFRARHQAALGITRTGHQAAGITLWRG
jgi:RNA polymerase sigma-70 factor, ECF subfamily